MPEVLELLVSVSDFETFKELMLDHKSALSANYQNKDDMVAANTERLHTSGEIGATKVIESVGGGLTPKTTRMK